MRGGRGAGGGGPVVGRVLKMSFRLPAEEEERWELMDDMVAKKGLRVEWAEHAEQRGTRGLHAVYAGRAGLAELAELAEHADSRRKADKESLGWPTHECPGWNGGGSCRTGSGERPGRSGYTRVGCHNPTVPCQCLQSRISDSLFLFPMPGAGFELGR